MIKREDMLVRGRVVARDGEMYFVSCGFEIDGQVVGRLINLEDVPPLYGMAQPLAMAVKYVPLELVDRPRLSLDSSVAGYASRFGDDQTPEQRIFRNRYDLFLDLHNKSMARPDAIAIATTKAP